MRLFIFGVCLCLLISCHQKNKFDTSLWTEQSEPGKYPNRKFIVDDLIKNYKLEGLSDREVIKLLGDPFPKNIFKSDTMWYPIEMKFDQKGYLAGAQSLILKFNGDSIVRAFELLEWEK
jgi:hypothetical protein